MQDLAVYNRRGANETRPRTADPHLRPHLRGSLRALAGVRRPGAGGEGYARNWLVGVLARGGLFVMSPMGSMAIFRRSASREAGGSPDDWGRESRLRLPALRPLHDRSSLRGPSR